MDIVIEIFDKNTEMLLKEVNIEDKYLEAVLNELKLEDKDRDFLLNGCGGFDLASSQVKKIERIISVQFFSNKYDYQIGSA